MTEIPAANVFRSTRNQEKFWQSKFKPLLQFDAEESHHCEVDIPVSYIVLIFSHKSMHPLVSIKLNTRSVL